MSVRRLLYPKYMLRVSLTTLANSTVCAIQFCGVTRVSFPYYSSRDLPNQQNWNLNVFFIFLSINIDRSFVLFF